jgi:hypothetical protein
MNLLSIILYLLTCIYLDWAIRDHNWSREAKITYKLLHGEEYESFN